MDASSDPYLPYDGGGDYIPLRELHKRGNIIPCSESTVGMFCMRLGGSLIETGFWLSFKYCSMLFSWPGLLARGKCNLLNVL